MIHGFATFANGEAQPFDSFDALRKAYAREDSVIWFDLEAPTEADLQELDSIIDVDDEALEDCLSGAQRPRIDEFEDYLFLVSYGVLGIGEDEFAPRKIAAFLGPRFLITIHREPLRTIRKVRERCTRNSAKLLADGTDAVLYTIIDGMVDNYLLVTDGLEVEIEELESQSLDPDVDAEILTEMVEHRRVLLELRRLAVSQRELVTPLARGEFDSIAESLEPRFRHVADHLSHVIDVVDGIRERLNVIRDNYNAAVANRTNQTMQMLTLVATLMLPMSLIAGIYGMNVPVWPPGDSAWSFWAVIGLMVALSGFLLAYFRRMRWI